jgi:hypothetical protein
MGDRRRPSRTARVDRKVVIGGGSGSRAGSISALDILREHGATATELAAAMSWLDAEHERWVKVALADFASGSSTI